MSHGRPTGNSARNIGRNQLRDRVTMLEAALQDSYNSRKLLEADYWEAREEVNHLLTACVGPMIASLFPPFKGEPEPAVA